MEQTANVLLLVRDDDFLKLSKHGTIWGTVYLQIGDNTFFPGIGWTDIVVAVAAEWLDALLSLSAGSAQRETSRFFDGDCIVQLTAIQSGLVQLHFIRDELVQASVTGKLSNLLANARATAKELLSMCGQKGWSNTDTTTLAALLQDELD
jgi:hypothetical protein